MQQCTLNMSSVLAPLSVNAQNEPTPRKQKSDSLDGHKRHFLSLVAACKGDVDEFQKVITDWQASRLGGVLDQVSPRSHRPALTHARRPP